jgi:hypothetical protein
MSAHDWYLITIVDPDGNPGSNFIKIIQLMMDVVNYKYLAIWDIYGGGPGMHQLKKWEREQEIIEVNELFPVLKEVIQVETADFYLFEEYPHSWLNIERDFNPNRLLSDTTVSSLDNTYIYIYTPDTRIVECVKKNYEIESLTKGPLATLEYTG